METLAIPISFISLSLILLLFFIRAKGLLLGKILLILLVPLWAIPVWFSVESYLGWPTEEPFPKKVEVLWAWAEEPSAIQSEPGAVYFIVEDMTEKKRRGALSFFLYPRWKDEPRMHKFPYTRVMHEETQKIRAEIMRGKRIIGELGGGTFDVFGESGPITGKRGAAQGSSENIDENKNRWQFYEMPEIQIPEKK
ncbi:hypothetical protein L0Y49_04305 [bacterium]|nr:hypothetical protein [bacterium]MCI0566207.1 hypothetical protein [bacterium]MCI0679766.1 hypothetical protein [bacterium]